MPLSKIQAESMNLADTYAFTGTVSGAGDPSDVKLISTTTISGTPSVVDVTDVFSASDDFLNYFVVFNNVIPSSDNVIPHMQYINSDNTIFTNSNYRWLQNGGEVQGTNNPNNDQKGAGWDDDRIDLISAGGTVGNNSAQAGFSLVLDIFNATESRRTNSSWQWSHVRSGNSVLINGIGGSQLNSGSVLKGFRFFFSSGNVASGKIIVYGRR